MKKRADVIIFDLDGTLIDSKLDIINSVNYTLKALGLKARDNRSVEGLIGKGVVRLLEDALGSSFKDRLDEALVIFKKYYKAHQFDTTRLYPNVKEILEYFSNKPKAIASNKSKELTVDCLDFFGIKKYFLKIVGPEEPGCLKPSSCQVDIILKALGIKNEFAVMVGDMPIDVETCKFSKITCCAVTYGLGKLEDLKNSKPDFIVDDIIELKDIIE